MMGRKSCCVVIFVFAAIGLGICEDSVQATVCEVKKDPAAYNHKLVELTGMVSHAFEDFTLFDPTCPSYPEIWLEYGGKSKSGTMYCCGVSADRHRPKELVIEDIPIPLTDDKQFRDFDKLIQPPFRSGRYGAIVHATVVGRFFAGRKMQYPKGTFWGGFGHMGCCSLLAIQEVKSVTAQDRDDLDYGASADQPDLGKVGCGYRELTTIDPTSDLIKAQQRADLSQNDWAFDDPKHVASRAIAQFAHVDEQSIAGLRQTHKAQGRYVYEWSPDGKAETYMVVVSRPYVVSFYARDPKRVAWLVIAAYLSSCAKSNSVTRIQ